MSVATLPQSVVSTTLATAPVLRSRLPSRPAFTLCSKALKDQHSYAGWLCAEKLDGVRAMWGQGKFHSRYGLTFRPPPWFGAPLERHLGPNIFLDGELWMGRQTFCEAAGIVRRHNCPEGWAKVQYHIYDLASDETAHLPYSERLDILRQLLEPITAGVDLTNLSSAIPKDIPAAWLMSPSFPHPHIFLHSPLCTLEGHSDVTRLCEDMVKAGGEGLILRDPQGKYLSGKRNPGIVKVKLHDDSEALVIGHVTYEGRGADRGVSSLVAVDRDRTIFKLGSGLTDEVRKDPPPVGTVIQYKYSEISAVTGRPRFPVYLRERTDMSKERFLEEMNKADRDGGESSSDEKAL
ncbi:hypothetical protein FOL47_008778 [Perkinsus chesapeaki]|uniref:ATP-dependent DNA ligase family profile domain-containing protein n=1 Tax=Perkinsus chesapeaki TaxID=330153 RepID=A0A7J6MT01_PERCH|nr:hypothetical protein FOL47_008778 [Perkinsus chesapeaki]